MLLPEARRSQSKVVSTSKSELIIYLSPSPVPLNLAVDFAGCSDYFRC
jgi:hypothetical protein